MWRLSTLAAAFGGGLVASMPAWPAGPVSPPAAYPAQLAEGLEAFEPLVGYAWEIETRWLGGEALKARQEYRAIMGGQFVEATVWASTTDGSIHQRYRTIFAHDDADEAIRSYTFDAEGEVRIADVDPGVITDDGEHPPLRSAWIQDFGGERVEVRQEVRVIDESTFAWKVWVAEPGAADLRQMMDGVWTRAEALGD